MDVQQVSKNQRSGLKQTSRPHFCSQGHEQVPVLVTGQGMTFQCPCTGYRPIDISLPYESRKPVGLPGKKVDAVRGGEAVVVGS